MSSLMEPSEQWIKIKQIVGDALELSPSQRPEFLRHACGQDPALREEVQSLLAAYAEADGLSHSPWSEQTLEAALLRQSIGPYRLVNKLGEGGMGQVWLAEQTGPVRRLVALKLIRGGFFDPILLQRFQAERQSLAIMDHPYIAKVFEAGATAEGQPYFAMEYVEGLPITVYCDEKKFSIPERLHLFVQVCDGIQHAHQKAIIHRDIKPANILVVEVDGKPIPRIIDFGLAKTIAAADSGKTLFTQVGSFLGTPGYTSPEQTDPSLQDIDTRTDVYSLGVVLYQLLAGHPPFDPERLKKHSLEKVLSLLREEDPQTPSDKVRRTRETSTTLAALRRTDALQLVTLLRGDLDWITMKALERDRERRYSSPSDLAADLTRYLANRPVLARPASRGYRVQKYVRRNRVAVSVAAGALALLIAFTVMQAFQLRRITRERDRANRVTDFITSMFKVSDPSEARGNTITAREILDKSSQEIETGLSKDPELQAKMMSVMGEVYLNLGLLPIARSLIEQSIDIRRPLLGLRNRETLDSLDKLAWVLQEQGRYAMAEKIEREILPIRREMFGPEDKDTLSSELNLANDLCEQAQYAESEKLDREALAIRERKLPEDPVTLIELSNLAITISLTGRYKESDQILTEALATMNRTLGPEHPFTIKALSNLADNYDKEGRFADAEQITRKTLAIRRRVLGPDHPDTLTNGGDLGTLLYEQDLYAEAEQIHRETLEKQKRITGPEHPQTLQTMKNLADDLSALHRYMEAEQLSRESWEIAQRVLGAEHPNTLRAAVGLGAVYRLEGRYAEAERITRAALYSQHKIFGDSHADCAFSEYNLAVIAAAQKKRDSAFALLQTALSHNLSPDLVAGLEDAPSLRPLHSDPRFVTLLAAARQIAARYSSLEAH